jgi:hypothetical protein
MPLWLDARGSPVPEVARRGAGLRCILEGRCVVRRRAIVLAAALAAAAGCAPLRPAKALNLGVTLSSRPRLSVNVCVLGLLPIRVGTTANVRFAGLYDGSFRLWDSLGECRTAGAT